MLLIAYAFKEQVHVFAGQVKIESQSSCRQSAILKYFHPLHMSREELLSEYFQDGHHRNFESPRCPDFVCLFDLILYVPSTIFLLYRDGSSGLNQY